MSLKETSQTFSHRYEILQSLGEGGIGSVHKAYDRWIGKDVALKVLAASQSDSSLLQEFKNEFSLLAELRHPGVVEVLDFGYSEHPLQADKTLPYFTMEFVEGKSLRESFPKLSDTTCAPAEFERLYHLIWQVCDILEFLHLRGLAHCDLKPDNLKLTSRDFRPKILDFGLSQGIGLKEDRKAKGTIPYMAPETFKQEPLDERTDLYSLGIILYELVTSRLPFWSDDPVKIISAHLQRRPVPPAELNANLPACLDELILRLLKKSPSDRPANAAQVKRLILEGLERDFPKSNKPNLSGENPVFAHLHSGALVGREKELAQLDGHLKGAINSRGSFLLLSGEKGVGKTFLLRQLRIKCQLQGIILVDSNCVENQTIAYQPVVETLHKLEPYAKTRCPDSVTTRLKDVFKWSSGESPDSHEAQASLHQRLADLLVEISQFFPFAVVVENLQWADPSTLRFLEQFQRRKGKGSMLLCCSLRDDRITRKPLEKIIENCREQKDADYLKLNRFDLCTTRELVLSKFSRSNFPSESFTYLHQRTSGNPFFVVEVLKYLLERDIIALKDSIWRIDDQRLQEAAVPNSIEAILLKNLERYDQETLDFLNVLAVTGKKITPRLLGQLYSFDEKKVLDMLSALSQDQLLVKQEASGEEGISYEFANQSLQHLLYQKLDEDKRKDLHRKVGRLLEKISPGAEKESVSDIAFHYLQAKEHEKAYKYALLSAGEMKNRFANDEVLRYLKTAIQVAAKLGQPDRALEKQVLALKRKADFCRTVGELNQAETDYLEILRLAEDRSDLKLLAQTYNGLGETYRLKHDYKKGISYLEKAMPIHKELNDPLELAHTLSYLGLIYWIDSQYQNALENFQVALQIDRKLGNRFYVGNTLNNIGLVHWSRHEYSKALEYFTQASSVYRQLGDKEWMARSLNNIGATLFELGEYERCIDHFLESFNTNEEIKNEKEVSFNLENLSEAYRKIGDYSAALHYGERGLNLARQIDFPGRVGRILKDLGTAYFELGDYHKAYAHFTEAKGLAEKIEDKELKVLVWIALGKFFGVLNDWRNSNRCLEEAITIINSIGDGKSEVRVYQVRSWFAKKEGRFDEALKLLDKAFAIAEKLNVGEEVVSLDLDYAGVYLTQGRVDDCKSFLNKASDLGLERYVLLQPTFHLICGKAESLEGDLRSAQAEFETALKLAERLRHTETLWQIHHQLAKVFQAAHCVEGAYQQLQNATRILKKLSKTIKDKELKRCYLRGDDKQELLSDLRAVARELIGETKFA